MPVCNIDYARVGAKAHAASVRQMAEQQGNSVSIMLGIGTSDEGCAHLHRTILEANQPLESFCISVTRHLHYRRLTHEHC